MGFYENVRGGYETGGVEQSNLNETAIAAGLAAALAKLEAAGVSPAARGSFARAYGLLQSGETGFIREHDVVGLKDLPKVDLTAAPTADDVEALAHTVVIKLNGGLGTGMGLDRAKSLLPVRVGPVPVTPGHDAAGRDAHPHDAEQPHPQQMLSFLDIIAGQIFAARTQVEQLDPETDERHPVPLMFMNSFRTEAETAAALAPYPELQTPGLPLSFRQNQIPKLLAETLAPVEWPADPDLEWCPPGHGDLYPALHGADLVNTLIQLGYRYLFVSNADNLGATPDARVAGWFARSGAPYAAEMCLKTPADLKGGQLVIRKADNQLIQRETAQTHPDDVAASLDPGAHPYFHTNNLWFDLHALQAELNRNNGVLELPLIRNAKTVDPTDPTSPAVVQLESAMGAAVKVFPGAMAVEVPRSRFLPVKGTSDLLLIRSDVYELDNDYHLNAVAPAPLVDFGGKYKTIAEFETRFGGHIPSLKGVDVFTVD